MPKIGLFYGSSTSNTEYVAYDIRDLIEAQLGKETVEVHNVGNTDLREMVNYDYLILGIPTWDIGELQIDWDIKWADLTTLDLSGHKIALFGLGDQYGYSTTFLDALGLLGEEVIARGGELVGYWSIADYEFEESMALTTDGQSFMGLAIDEDNQGDVTAQRIKDWTHQILVEFGLFEKVASV